MSRREPMTSVPPVVWAAIGVLIAVHAALQLLDHGTAERLMIALAFVTERYREGGDALPGGWAARFLSPLTYSLVHADWLHLAVNAVWGIAFGTPVVRVFGAKGFLLIAAVASAGGALAHDLFAPADGAIVIGASGAVSGLTAAALALLLTTPPRASARLRSGADALGTAPIARSPRFLAASGLWIGTNAVVGLLEPGIGFVDEPIAWQAHIGGFVAGMVTTEALARWRAARLTTRHEQG